MQTGQTPPPSDQHERESVVRHILSAAPEELTQFLTGPAFQRYATLLGRRVWDQPMDAFDRLTCDALCARFAAGVNDDSSWRAWLAARLYRPNFRLPHVFDLARLPPTAAGVLAAHLLVAPNVWEEKGDTDLFIAYLEAVIAHLFTLVERDPTSALARAVLKAAAPRMNFIPAYFNNRTLKGLYTLRAALLERALVQDGAALNWTPPPRGDRAKIRLGILQSQFVPHTEVFTTLPVYEHLDPARFEVTLLALRGTGSAMEERCRALAANCVVLPEGVNKAVETVRALDLDLLVFGTNVTAVTSRMTVLAMHRMARAQVTGFSSPVSTGMRHMDYYISGELSDGPDGQEHYRERLLRLPGCGFCFEYGLTELPEGRQFSRANLNIPEDAVVFASGANLFKITAELRETWARILARVPNSILVLYPFGPAWSNNYPEQRFVRAIGEDLTRQGVAGRVRLVKDLTNRKMVKALLRVADVYLDSFPYSGANSNVDPLELGMPVAVLQGDTMRTAQGAAMMHEFGFPDLVAKDVAEYVALAEELGQKSGYRNAIAQRISERMAMRPAFLDTEAYGAQIGRVFEDIVQAS